MKKFLLLSGLLIFTASILNAQSPRMVFIEEITQASCPPCAPFNAILTPFVEGNSDKVIFLAYQVWWPGYDVMYLDNPADVNARVGYYNGNSAPSVVSQGSTGPLNAQPTQTFVNNTYAETSEFDMTVSAEVVDGMLNITGSIDATTDVSGNLKLRLVLTEKIIHIADAPGGTNGETEYHHVMKKFVGGTNGITLPSSWTAGDSYTINESFNTFDLKIYDYSELEVIAFIQNDNGKFVHQAAKDDQVDLIINHADNAVIQEMELPEAVCSGSQDVSPYMRVTNGGSSDLTSIDFVTSVNGGNDVTYNWTGNIAPLEFEYLTVDPVTFTAMSSNDVEVQLTNPNGNVDGDMSNNDINGSLGLAPAGNNNITLTIQLDNWADETSWELWNSGAMVAEGGPYDGQNNQLIEEQFSVTIDCFTLRMIDSFGDGLHAAQWGNYPNGSFSIEDNDGNVLVSGGGTEEWSERDDLFDVTYSTGINDIEQLSSLDIYPNPTSSNLTVDFNIDKESIVSLELYNVVGELVFSQAGQQFSGSNIVNIDVSNFNSGMYTLNMIVDGNYATSKISILK